MRIVKQHIWILFNARLRKVFTDFFNYLIFAALIDDSILCMHGGLSLDLLKLDQIKGLTHLPEAVCCVTCIRQIVVRTQVSGMNGKGIFHTFGADKGEEFLSKDDLDLVCHAHQVLDSLCVFFWLLNVRHAYLVRWTFLLVRLFMMYINLS